MTQTAVQPVDPDSLKALIQQELSDLIAIRHDLHAHPELRYEEKRTSALVAAQLTRAGVATTGNLAGGTGLIGHLSAGTSAGISADNQAANPHAVGLRADMDALPMTERTGVSYASKHPGLMHACGHDGHTTILLGAARVLAKLRRTHGLPRPVTFLFQPAEEGGAGAQKMIDDGALDGRHTGVPVSQIFGLHGWPRLQLGSVMTRSGPILASSDAFEILISGQGGHAAFPHQTRDPIAAGAAVYSALQTIVSRNIDPMEPMVLSVTQFHAGSANNIVPPTATLSGTVRTFSSEARTQVQTRLTEIAQHTAKAMNCEAHVTYNRGYPVTLNDPASVEAFNTVAAAAISPQNVVHMKHAAPGSEDFSYYSQAIPACFFLLGLSPEGDPATPDLHHPAFNFNDNAIPLGVELFCRLALRG